MTWWWLSFVDPRTGKWLGCTVVNAMDEFAAVKVSHALGVNPGGEVAFQKIVTDVKPPVELLEQLVTDRVDAQVHGRRWVEGMEGMFV